MEFFSQTFFVRKGKAPRVRARENLDDKAYPISMTINCSENSWDNPQITFHFESEADYITFKNSAISAHEAILRSRNKNAKKGLDK
jgi:hypothetical protein